MKLTDQEQVILKAIGNGVAEVSRVIRSVGYPKATVKKVLIRLNEKGAVALHRHDWPSSLTPDQRKLMVKIGSNYYNAVSVMKRNPKQSKGKTALKKTGRALKGLTRGALSAGAQILGAGAEALNPSRRRKKTTKKRNKTVIRAKRVVVLNPKKKRVKRNASRTVSAAKTAKRRARPSSQNSRKLSKARSKKIAVKRNASPTARAKSRIRSRKAPARRASSNPTRKGLRRGYAKARRLSKKSGDTKTMRLAARYMKQRGIKHAPRPKRTRKNPDAASIRKEFAGSVNGERDLFFPQGTPSGKLAKLGKLVSITTEEGIIKPVSGTAWLCADTKGKLHIGSTSGAPLFDGPKRSFGHVTKLEYESSKPHLGYRGPIIWFHRAGEENGIRPTLHADGKGGLVFRGGDYRLTQRGIEN
jgi:hypothetical protein